MFLKSTDTSYVQLFRLWTTFSSRHYQTLTGLRQAIQHRNLNRARHVYEDLVSQSKQTIDKDNLRQLILLARNGRQKQDISFLQQLIQDMPTKWNLTPRHFEYHALIHAYGIHKLTDKAYGVFNMMQKVGLKPTIYTYNTLLGCYKRVDDLASSLALLDDMKKNGVQPDIGTYNTILHLYSKTGSDYQTVYDVYQTMIREKVKPDTYTYSIMLDAAVRSNNAQLGDELYAQLMERIPPKQRDVNLMNNILRYKGLKDYDEALDLYQHLSSEYPHIKPDRITYNVMMDIAFKNDHYADAMNILEDMDRSHTHPDAVTYGTLIDGEARHGDLGRALSFYRDMRDDSVEPNDKIINSLMNMGTQATLDELRELMDIVSSYQDRLYLDTQAYNSLLSGLAQHGCSAQVQKIYDSVFRDKRLTPTIATFTHLVLGYINDGYLQDALEIYKVIREHHKKCEDRSFNPKIPVQLDSVFYSTLISSLSRPHPHTKSHSFADHPDFPDSSPRLLTALTIFNDMRTLRIQPSAYTYTALLHACGQYCDYIVLRHIHQLIKVDLFLDPDTALFNALMDAYNRTGDGETVLEIWNSMSLDHPSHLSPDQTTVSIVLDSCGHNGYGYYAHRIWNDLQSRHFPLNTNNYISYMECLCREPGRDGWYKACELLKTDIPWPEKAFNTLISFAKKKGIPNTEIEVLENQVYSSRG